LKLQVFNFRTKLWEEQDIDLSVEDIKREEQIVKNLSPIELIDYHQAWISIINTINIMNEGKNV
jgi:hypothetical protein